MFILNYKERFLVKSDVNNAWVILSAMRCLEYFIICFAWCGQKVIRNHDIHRHFKEYISDFVQSTLPPDVLPPTGSRIAVGTVMEKFVSCIYSKAFNISHCLLGNELVDHSDAVAASPVGAATTTSSSST